MRSSRSFLRCSHGRIRGATGAERTSCYRPSFPRTLLAAVMSGYEAEMSRERLAVAAFIGTLVSACSGATPGSTELPTVSSAGKRLVTCSVSAMASFHLPADNFAPLQLSSAHLSGVVVQGETIDFEIDPARHKVRTVPVGDEFDLTIYDRAYYFYDRGPSKPLWTTTSIDRMTGAYVSEEQLRDPEGKPLPVTVKTGSCADQRAKF